METREVVVQDPFELGRYSKKYGIRTTCVERVQGALPTFVITAPSEMFDEMARAGIIVLDN